LIVNNIYSSSACKGDGGEFMFFFGKGLYQLNQNLPYKLFQIFSFLKKKTNLFKFNKFSDEEVLQITENLKN